MGHRRAGHRADGLAGMKPLLALLFLLVLGPSPSAAQQPEDPIFQLARRWAGPAALVACREKGEFGEDLDTPESRYCEWSLLRARDGFPKLSGTFGTPVGSVVMWQRRARTRVDADRLVDSLRIQLRNQGLEGHRCAFGGDAPAGHVTGEIWERPGLYVHIGRVAPRTGVIRLMITAGNVAASFPEVLCQKVVGRIS